MLRREFSNRSAKFILQWMNSLRKVEKYRYLIAGCFGNEAKRISRNLSNIGEIVKTRHALSLRYNI